MSPYYWLRAPLKRDRRSHVVAHAALSWLLSPRARYGDSLHIHPFHPCEKNERVSVADGANGRQPPQLTTGLREGAITWNVPRSVSLLGQRGRLILRADQA